MEAVRRVQEPSEKAASTCRGGEPAGQGVPAKPARMSFHHMACSPGCREERSQNASLSSSSRGWGAAPEALRWLEHRQAPEVTPAALHLAPPTGKRRRFGAFSCVDGVSYHDGPVLPALSVMRQQGSVEKPTHRHRRRSGEHPLRTRSPSVTGSSSLLVIGDLAHVWKNHDAADRIYAAITIGCNQ